MGRGTLFEKMHLSDWSIGNSTRKKEKPNSSVIWLKSCQNAEANKRN